MRLRSVHLRWSGGSSAQTLLHELAGLAPRKRVRLRCPEALFGLRYDARWRSLAGRTPLARSKRIPKRVEAEKNERLTLIVGTRRVTRLSSSIDDTVLFEN